VASNSQPPPPPVRHGHGAGTFHRRPRLTPGIIGLLLLRRAASPCLGRASGGHGEQAAMASRRRWRAGHAALSTATPRPRRLTPTPPTPPYSRLTPAEALRPPPRRASSSSVSSTRGVGRGDEAEAARLPPSELAAAHPLTASACTRLWRLRASSPAVGCHRVPLLRRRAAEASNPAMSIQLTFAVSFFFDHRLLIHPTSALCEREFAERLEMTQVTFTICASLYFA
jgi:hypothetical protein